MGASITITTMVLAHRGGLQNNYLLHMVVHVVPSEYRYLIPVFSITNLAARPLGRLKSIVKAFFPSYPKFTESTLVNALLSILACASWILLFSYERKKEI